MIELSLRTSTRTLRNSALIAVERAVPGQEVIFRFPLCRKTAFIGLRAAAACIVLASMSMASAVKPRRFSKTFTVTESFGSAIRIRLSILIIRAPFASGREYVRHWTKRGQVPFPNTVHRTRSPCAPICSQGQPNPGSSCHRVPPR